MWGGYRPGGAPLVPMPTATLTPNASPYPNTGIFLRSRTVTLVLPHQLRALGQP